MSGRDRGGEFGGRPGQPAVSQGFLRKGLGKPRASAAKAEVPSLGLTEPSRGQGYGQTRAGSPQGPPRAAFWAEVEVGSSRWRMQSGLGHHQEVIPPGLCLPCPERCPRHQPVVRPGCPMPPVLTHVRPAGPGCREGADPTPCLTLSGLACVQWPGRGQGLGTSPPPPCPG